MDALTVIFSAIDLPLVAGIVALIQTLKGMMKKAPPKWVWFLVLIASGFVAAWLKIDVSQAGGKSYLVQGIIYSAGANLVYKGWGVAKYAVEAATSKRKGK